MQVFTEEDAVFVQFRIATQNPLAIIVRLAVNAEPDLARLDVRIEQIEDHIGL